MHAYEMQLLPYLTTAYPHLACNKGNDGMEDWRPAHAQCQLLPAKSELCICCGREMIFLKGRMYSSKKSAREQKAT